MTKDCYDCRNSDCPFNKAPTAEDFDYYECNDFKAQYAEELEKRNQSSLASKSVDGSDTGSRNPTISGNKELNE